MIEQRASAKGLSVGIEADSLPERLFGDAERLSQALLNYAANAVKFTEAGSITLRARIVEDGESSCLVRIEVVDTELSALRQKPRGAYSESFQQADGFSSRRFGGAVLGLAVTRELVRLMGGRSGCRVFPGGAAPSG